MIDKSQILGIALVHGAAREAVARHEEIWLRTCDRIVYFAPIDDCLSLPGRTEYGVGKSGNYSAHTNQRCREALRFASLTRYNFVQAIEWDSMIFDLPKVVGEKPIQDVYAPVFHDPENPKFKGKFYLHFPQIYRRVALERLVAEMDKLPLDAEGGFSDRYFGLAVERAGLTYCDMNKMGAVYTQNHIDAPKLGEALAAYRDGARWSHGVKDAAVFAALKNAADTPRSKQGVITKHFNASAE